MGKKIISSKNEYEINYNKLLENFKSIFDEVDEIDFVNDEIQDYKLYSIIVASRTNVVFNPMFNVFDGLASKEEGYTEDIIKIFKENKSVYYSIREVLGLDPIYWTLFTEIEDIDIKVRQLRLGFSKILTFLEQRKLSLETNTITETPKKDFKDFFKEHINIDKIEVIQKKYKDFDGKKMAYVIYLLHKEFNVINYSLNSRVESRKHFVFALYKKDNINKMEGINRYFNPSDITLLAPDYSKDNDYTTIKTDIQTILNTI